MAPTASRATVSVAWPNARRSSRGVAAGEPVPTDRDLAKCAPSGALPPHMDETGIMLLAEHRPPRAPPPPPGL